MLRPKSPSREYDRSSSLVVTLRAAQDSLAATLKSPNCTSVADSDWTLGLSELRESTFSAIPVTSTKRVDREDRVPMKVHSEPKKKTSEGATSSCNVQPLVNHFDFLNPSRS